MNSMPILSKAERQLSQSEITANHSPEQLLTNTYLKWDSNPGYQLKSIF